LEQRVHHVPHRGEQPSAHTIKLFLSASVALAK
jgi:hypothetical protein